MAGASDLDGLKKVYMAANPALSMSCYSMELADKLAGEGVKVTLLVGCGCNGSCRECGCALRREGIDVVKYGKKSGGDIEHCTRDWGIFGKNKFYFNKSIRDEKTGARLYGETPFAFVESLKKRGAAVADMPFGGGSVVSDGKIGVASLHSEFMERELATELYSLGTELHADYFFNFLSAEWVLYNRDFAKNLCRYDVGGYANAHGVLDRADGVARKLASGGYNIYEISRLKNGFGGWHAERHLPLLGNALALGGGKVIMTKDWSRPELESRGIDHVPTALRREGIDVIEVDFFRDGPNPIHQSFYEAGGGPRCMTLPVRRKGNVVARSCLSIDE